MDRLPFEVMQMITSHCTRLSSLAAVSRRWNDAVEPHTLVTIRIGQFPDELEMFERLFSVPGRRRLLSQLTFVLQSPYMGADPPTGMYVGLLQLLSCLEHWEEESNVGLGFDIIRRNYSSDDSEVTLDWCFGCGIDDPYDLLSLSFDLTWTPLPTLPTLKAVTSLTDNGNSLDPLTLGAIAEAFPRLKNISTCYNTRSCLGGGHRESLAKVFLEVPFAHLESFTLETIIRHSPASSPNEIMFSKAMRRIAQLPLLQKFCLKGLHILLPDFFSISDGSNWPSLRLMEIEASLDYFAPLSLEKSPHGFLTTAGIETSMFDPFILAMTKAVSAMPALQRLTFSMSRYCGDRPPVFSAEYLGPQVAGTIYRLYGKDLEEFEEKNKMHSRWELCFSPRMLFPVPQTEPKRRIWMAPEAIKDVWEATVGKRVYLGGDTWQ